MGIVELVELVELAVENQSVRDYVEHWEGRTLTAEREQMQKNRELIEREPPSGERS